MPITVLVTANVFQNGLSRHEQSWRYYTDLLCRLPRLQNINWYISELDRILAFDLWDYFQMGGDRDCQAAYLQMRSLLRVCKVDQRILEDSGFANLNFFDAIRLACAVDINANVILTWEPSQFASTDRERRSVNGYFDRTLRSEFAEDGSIINRTIRVSTVSAFLLYLNDRKCSSSQEEKTGCFQLKHHDFRSCDEDNLAIVEVSTPTGELIQGEASGLSPCDAISAAIDQCVDRCVILPRRSLLHFNVPDMIGSASSPVDVMISVACDRRFFQSRVFQASANHTNVLRAFANAYIDVINQICSDLDFDRLN